MNYQLGDKVLGGWEIVRKIGEGASGEVFEIQKEGYGISARSALKVIRVPKTQAEVEAAYHEGMDELSVTAYFRELVSEIVREIAVLAELKGLPGIVGYEDHSVIRHENSMGWDILIRMELLMSLQEYQSQHEMDRETVLRMAVELSEALEHCEKHGLVHRDIKPQNIFVNQRGQFKLGDFGVARTMEKTVGAMSRTGTESYMAPEVYKGLEYGANVDIYSLGLVLYRCLNENRFPFLPLPPNPVSFREYEEALIRRMRGEVFPAPVDADNSLTKIILKACAYNPMERYRTATELKNDIQRIQNLEEYDRTRSNEIVEIFAMNGKKYRYNEETIAAHTPGLYQQKLEHTPKKTPWLRIILLVLVLSVAAGFGSYILLNKEDSDNISRTTSADIQSDIVTNLTAEPEMEATIPEKFTITIHNGSGSAVYLPGETVTITADPPETDYVFQEWEIDQGNVTLANAMEETTSFVCGSENVVISAVYAQKRYSVTVHNGSGTGEYYVGENVVITAEPANTGYGFSGWKIVRGNVTLANAAAETTSFLSMSEDVEVEALYFQRSLDVLPGQIEFNGHFYQLYMMESFDWEKAQQFCLSVGGSVANISSDEELVFLEKYIKDYVGNIDIYLQNIQGNWEKVVPEQTRVYQAENILRAGQWEPGNNLYNIFVCEWDDAMFQAPLKVGRNLYYVFYEDGITWDNAKQRCELAGGHLVTITSDNEQRAITNYIQTNVEDTDIWIGLTDLNHEGTWNWVTGEPYAYSNWGRNEPDDGWGDIPGGQNYAVVCNGFREDIVNYDYTVEIGQWDDLQDGGITTPGYYLCEWDA